LGAGYVCELDGSQSVSARAVVLATGVDWRLLQAKGEDRLLGRGIFYGAARHEAANVIGKKIFVIGGDNSAGQAAMFLSSYAAEVKVLEQNQHRYTRSGIWEVGFFLMKNPV